MRLEPVNPGFGGLRRCLNAPDPGMSTSVRVLSYSLAGNTKLTRHRGALQIPIRSQPQPLKGLQLPLHFSERNLLLLNSFKIQNQLRPGLAEKLSRLHMQNESPGGPLDLNHVSSYTVLKTDMLTVDRHYSTCSQAPFVMSLGRSRPGTRRDRRVCDRCVETLCLYCIRSRGSS
jgi:hypothetical protein